MRSAPSSSMFRCPAPAICPRRTWPTTSGSGAWITGGSSWTWRRATGTTPSPSGAPILTAAWCGSRSIRRPTDVPAAELDRNIAFFRQLFQMAADRGLDTYLVTWNIHVSRAFAERHHVPAAGFDSPLIRDYQREAIQALFATYPMLTGLGTTAGERMDVMTAKQKMDWIADTYLAALKQVGRPVPFILRYWQAEPEAARRHAGIRRLPRPGVPGYQVQRRAHVLVGRAACARSEMGGAGARPLPPALAPAQRRPVHPPLGRPRFRARNRAPHVGPGYGRLRGRLGGGRARRGPHPHRGRQSAPGLAIHVREALVPLHALGPRGLLPGRAGFHLARPFPAALRSGGR